MEVSINMFFLIVTALGLVGSTFSWGMYRTGFSLLHSAWTLLPFLLMPLIFAIGNIFTESLPVTLIRYFSWSGGVWMGFIFYSVLLSIFYVFVGSLAGFPSLRTLHPMRPSQFFSSLFWGPVLVFTRPFIPMCGGSPFARINL